MCKCEMPVCCQDTQLVSSAAFVKCLVPALEELLEDDGLFPLWQNLHLQHNEHKRLLYTYMSYSKCTAGDNPSCK